MGRPVKNNCDYFSHDRDMRNHKKIKAIRAKYKATGYAIWVMFLEYLTGSESNIFEYTDLEIELLAGDFDVSVTEIRSVLDYCIQIGLLNNKNGIINSNSLDERLAPVYAKRNRLKGKSEQQLRVNGKFTTETNEHAVVSVTETPQSKVNKSKVNKSKKSPLQEIKIIDYELTDQTPFEEKVIKQFHSLFCQIATPEGKELKDKTLLSAKLDSWKKDFKGLTEIDKRSQEDLREVYNHIKNSTDKFWANTVSSLSGVRKNFDKIMAKIRLEKENNKKTQVNSKDENKTYPGVIAKEYK